MKFLKTETKTMRSKSIKLKYNAGHKRACQGLIYVNTYIMLGI